jgi:hypothetical protein
VVSSTALQQQCPPLGSKQSSDTKPSIIMMKKQMLQKIVGDNLLSSFSLLKFYASALQQVALVPKILEKEY